MNTGKLFHKMKGWWGLGKRTLSGQHYELANIFSLFLKERNLSKENT
jgi:hypothetical protein